MAAKMFSAQTIKRFTSIHSWIGICTGMALFIAFFCGALVIYEHELHQWTNPDLRRGFGDAALLDKVVAKVAVDPTAKGNFSVSLGDEGQGPVKASFYEFGEGRRFVAHTRALDARLDLISQQTISGLAHHINHIHFTLGIPGALGYNLMGVVSLVYALALITGLIIHLPHLLKDLFGLRTGKNLKKMWTDAHNVIGVLSLPFHLMFAITAVVFCLSFTINEMLADVMPSKQAYTEFQSVVMAGFEHGGGGRREAPAAPAAMLKAADLIAAAQRHAPQMRVTGVSFRDYGTERARATVEGRFRNAIIAKGSVELSAVDGSLKKMNVPGLRDGATLLNSGYMELHIGNYGGEVIKFIYFVLGLAGAFLFYSGNLLWVETRRKSRSVEQPRSGWVMAQLTVGICLGCCLGVGLALVGNKVLPATFADRGTWEQNLYHAGFFAAVIWGLARPPARAAIELLYALAAVYLALPLLNMVVTGDNLVRAAREGLWDIVVIDVIFLACAAGFFAMARATQRRARFGQPNSVWSLASSAASAKTTGGEKPHVAA